MPPPPPACEVIEISQQNMAVVLTVAIQALVIGGLLACIIVGPQVGSSPATSSSGEGRHMDRLSGNPSTGADPVGIRQPEVRLPMGILAAPSGGTTIAFSA